jgi:hypothetical protein
MLGMLDILPKHRLLMAHNSDFVMDSLNRRSTFQWKFRILRGLDVRLRKELWECRRFPNKK